MLKINNSRGDTIVEVLICIAILGFSLTTAYSIMNSSTISARNAQEHSEALEYMNSQVELTRSIAYLPALFKQTTPFCMVEDQIKSAASPTPDPLCSVGEDGLYKLSIVRSETKVKGITQHIFTFTITWSGPGQTGPQKEEISYKIYEGS